jgi:hypothetical protein
MADITRCPYCVQGDNFRPMKPRSEGRWFMCEACDHTVMPDKAKFECECQKCEELSRPLRDEFNGKLIRNNLHAHG